MVREQRPGSGGAAKFLRFITEELIPYVEDNYRTDSPNVIYGGSNAGLFTVYAIFTAPEKIQAAIAGSPMIGHCPNYMNRLLDDLNEKDNLN